MDATATALLGAATTVGAVVVSHFLNQRSGEKRANDVRQDIVEKINALDARVTEVKRDILDKIADLKVDSREQATLFRAELKDAADGIRGSINLQRRHRGRIINVTTGKPSPRKRRGARGG